MRSSLLSIAKRTYHATSSQSLRKMYYDLFARLVRNRHAIVEVDGARFELDLGEDIDLRLYLHQFEPDVAAALRRETKPGMTVIDIGANIGAHTMLLASLVGPQGRVIAFEPTDYGWRKLQRNLSLNTISWIVPVKAALSDRHVPEQRVDFRASWRTEGGRKDGESIVDFLRLDDWCAERGINSIDVIKIDVDGNEYSALLGARSIVSRSLPRFVMEAMWVHFADDARNPFRFLQDLGYSFHDLRTREGLSLAELRARLPEHDPGLTASTNVLALGPSSH